MATRIPSDQSQLRLRSIADPFDPDLAALSRLLDVTFADPDIVLGLDRMQEFLASNDPAAARQFCVIVAKQHDSVVAGSVFSYVARSNCGFSEYLLTNRALRGQGLGRLIFDARKARLNAEAARLGHGACRGLFIEVEHPDRTPPDVAAAERETALDGWERLRVFDHLGFRRVAVPYVQPPLAEGKRAIDYLNLLFARWDPAAPEHIPAAWVFDTVEAIWSAWTPQTADQHLATLKRRVPSPHVGLFPCARPNGA